MTCRRKGRSGVLSVCIAVLAVILVFGFCNFSEAANATAAGVISALAVDETSILLRMPYTGDDNNNNYYTVQYKPCAEGSYTDWETNAPHISSPYKTTITGLAANTCYDIKATFNDTDNAGGPITQKLSITSTWDNTLLHNINRFPESGKWTAEGGWGLPDTKYGKINCETCHIPRATNIKGISGNITAPNGTDQFPGQTGGLGINFKSLTTPDGFGDDTGGHIESRKICEYCHSQTTYHSYNTAGQTYLTHNNNTNCLTCHPHAAGFYYATGACDTCHGNPPVVSSVGGPEGLASAPATGSETPGAHSAHTAKSVVCNNCHYYSAGTGGTHRDSSVTLGFYAFGGGYQGGAYDGQTTVSSYNAATTTPATNVSKTGTKTCSNIYCHGATMEPNGGTDTTPAWDNPATGACGACHGATASNPPAKGSHAKHAGSADGGRALVCTACHYAYETSHVNNEANLAFDTATYSWLSGATYSGDPAMLNAYGSCSNLYCHSNVQNNGGTSGPTAYAAPIWGSASTGACGTCHGPDTGTKIATGNHTKHVALSPAGNNFSCSNCHNGAGTGTVKHADNNIDVAFNSVNPSGVYSQSSGNPSGNGYGTCTNLYCHSNANPEPNLDPARHEDNAYKTVTWGQAETLACDACHRGKLTDTLTMRANGHDRLSGKDWIRKYPCHYCHAATVDTNDDISDKTKHGDKVKDVVMFSKWTILGRTAPTYDSGTKVCANVYCHSDGTDDPEQVRPFAWTEGSTSCNTCHGHPKGSCNSSGCHNGRTDGNGKYWEVKTAWPAGEDWKAAMPMFTNQGPGTARANSHPRHLQTDFQCDVCHYATIKNGTCTDCHINAIPSGAMGEVAHIEAAKHVNTIKDVVFKNGGTYNPDKTCSSTVCHTGGVDPQWGGSVNNTVICLTCHGTTVEDVDDFGVFNGVRGKINTTEWETSGHGRKTASGNYPSGNPPANFPGNPCWYCHDNSVLHKDPNNPFRLRQHQQFAMRFEKECVYCHMERIDSECLGCHNATESLAPQLSAIAAPEHSVDHSGFVNGQTSCLTSGCHLPQDAGQCRSCHASTGNSAPQLISGRVYVSLPVSPYTKDHADYAGDATNCLSASCHTDDAHIHNTGAGAWTSSLKADVKNQYMMMGVCLQCHEDDSNGTCTKCHLGPQYAIGFDPGTGFIKPQKARADSVHYGYKHFQQGTTKGGKFCWDCHDPHGDSNISMIQKKVATSTDGLYGRPAIRAEVVFTKKVTGMDYAKTSEPYNGICNVCHSDDPETTQHYGASHGDGHNSGRVCTTCHEHRFNSSHASGQDCNSCHRDKPVPSHTAFGLPRDCTKCHSGLLGKRMDILGQFKASSHHVQGTDISNKNCYVCHWEATADGLINRQYHEGYNNKTHASTKNAKVDLVILGPKTRPAVYQTSNPETFATTFLASNMGTENERAEVSKVTSHCLSCHSDQNNEYQPFGDCKTPRQYSWDRQSIAARYAQTGTTTWGKYSGVTNASKKNITKAYSAHGNAQNNLGGGWNTTDGEDGSLATTRGGVSANSVQCFDCHNSHGSKTNGTTSSYVTFNGTKNGANLKETQAGKGGYGVTYRAVAKTDGVNPYNVGAGQCFDCHESASVGTTTNASPEYKTPWGYQGTFNASAPVMGYNDTQRFGLGTKWSQTRYPLKASRPVLGGHLKATSGMGTTPMGTIDGLCTPCHDPHGVSPSLGSEDQAYAVPLLKGTWMTSPYKEDIARDGASSGAISGKPTGNSVTPYVNTDQKTFGGSTRINEGDAKFAGLCLQCHPKTALDPDTTSTWKSMDRVHETVKDWGANTQHSYPCSKCHQPHNSGLPRLMKTNCLDTNHRGRVTSGGIVSNTGGGYPYERPFGNAPYGWIYAAGSFPKGFSGNNSYAYYKSNCHPAGAWPDNKWNSVTPW